MNASEVAGLKAERRAALAEIEALKARRKASLEDCINTIDAKPAHVFLSALRGELAAVVAIWDAEAALAQPSPSKPTAPAPAEAKASATAPAAPARKKNRNWLLKLLPTV